MPVRPLDLLDLPTIYRYRHASLALDITRALTRGDPLGPIGLLAYLNPTRHVYTAVSKHDDQAPLMGSVTHRENDTSARLSFLAPRDDLVTDGLPALLDHLAEQAGKWGAVHVQAEVDELSPVFKTLRRAGFAVYAWQRVWDLSTLSSDESSSTFWMRARQRDLLAVHNLYFQIMPALLQPVQTSPKRVSGMVLREADEVRGYVELIYGPYGILLNPLIHPNVEKAAERLSNLVRALPDRRGRPIYLCMRSYQTWLEPALEDLGALSGPRQAVMVKYLAAAQRAEKLAANPEAAWAKPAAPMAHTSNRGGLQAKQELNLLRESGRPVPEPIVWKE
jgi:hypothetical protein